MSAMDDIREDAYVHVSNLDGAINATDKVYRNSASKRLIKVRVVRQAPPPNAPGFGMLVFVVSGSHCGEDGKALTHGEGHRIAPAHTVTVQSDRPVELTIALERARKKACVATERAVVLEESAAALSAASDQA